MFFSAEKITGGYGGVNIIEECSFNVISELCDPVIVLAEGSVLFKGSAEEVKSNEQVIESYLGKGLKK